MDPTACYLAMYYAMRDKEYETARGHALDLMAWFRKGGFAPHPYTMVEAYNYTAGVIRRTMFLA